MKDKKFIPFWMEKEKIEIIEAYAECIHNGEVLLERIEKAVEYIENTPLYETTYDYNMEEELELQNVSDETASNDLLNILKGEEKENG